MTAERKRVAFHTLGCKLNFAETSYIARSLPEDRYQRVPADDVADIYIINTCSVTDAADRKCRQVIKKFIHRSPGSFIVVAGCYSQLKPQEISSIPGVDLVLGSNEKFDIARWLESAGKKKTAEVHSSELTEDDTFHTAWSAGDRTRSFLKVQDGCDYTCSYCTIPFARGKSRNTDIDFLVGEAVKIAEAGIREIVLTGVNIGDFGKSTGESFTSLLRALVKVKGIERIRLSSVEPNLLDDEIIMLVAENNIILQHFHIPLQSGSNKILALMRRRYKREVFAGRVEKIRELMPLAGIGADVITGFPGENDSDFEDTYNFIRSLPLTYLHVFSYSERPGTAAAELPAKVAAREKEARSKMLISLSETLHSVFQKYNIGKTDSVLFEHSASEGMITGFTGNYLRVEHGWNSDIAGCVRRVRITGIGVSGNLTVELIQ